MSEIIRTETEVIVVSKQEKRYLVKELEQEKAMLMEELNISEPTDEELIDLAKAYHPYYGSKEDKQLRIDEINNLLGVE